VTLLLDNDDVRSVLRVGDCIDALRASLADLAAGEAIDRPRSHTCTDLGGGRYYLFKSMDGGLPRGSVQAREVGPRTRDAGVGRELPTGWSTQEEKP
jgi:hypothetical protein